MKELKHKQEVFLFHDHTGIEKHLKEMAEWGWGLSEINRFIWSYRRIEPKRHYCAAALSVLYGCRKNLFKNFVRFCA